MIEVDCTIIIPVYQNVKVIEELINRIDIALNTSDISYRILAIDDASIDSSWQILESLTINNPNLAAIKLKHNLGQQKAILVGLFFSKSTYIAVMDADLQDPPELLPQMLLTAQQNKHTVFAERHGSYEAYSRLILSMLHKNILRLLIGLSPKFGTFFIIPKNVLQQLLLLSGESPHIVVLAACASKNITKIPFQRPRRLDGKSSYTFKKLFISAYQAYSNVFRCKFFRRGKRITKQMVKDKWIEQCCGWISINTTDKE